MTKSSFKSRRRFLALSVAGTAMLGKFPIATAQETPTAASLYSFLQSRLPPSEESFEQIFTAYLGFADQSLFLRTLATLEKDVEIFIPFLNSVQLTPGTFEKLAETLLLFRNNASDKANSPQIQAQVIRRAYQHYLINTNGPIPMRPSADDFDVKEWATEYASEFSMIVSQSVGEGRQLETQVTIDDPSSPVRFKAWSPVAGRSSAWTLRDIGHIINYRRYGRHDVISSRLFSFEPQTLTHSQANAIWLAEISQLVYLKETYVVRQLENWGFRKTRWIDDANDTQAVVAAHKDYIVVGFRGTESGKDFLTDLKFRKKSFYAGPGRTQPAGKVHRGFLNALDGAWDQVLSNVNAIGDDKPVFVTGHSLGAALAQLAAIRLKAHGKNVAGVYTYGSPRVGNTDFRDAYNAMLSKRTFLHINDQDIVTQVPPRWTGYVHVSDSLRRFDNGHSISVVRSGTDQPISLPSDENADAVNQRLMNQAATTLRESQRYLQETDLTQPDTVDLSYSADFDDGRLDDHGVSQYLFKFACAVVESKMKLVQ